MLHQTEHSDFSMQTQISDLFLLLSVVHAEASISTAIPNIDLNKLVEYILKK